MDSEFCRFIEEQMHWYFVISYFFEHVKLFGIKQKGRLWGPQRRKISFQNSSTDLSSLYVFLCSEHGSKPKDVRVTASFTGAGFCVEEKFDKAFSILVHIQDIHIYLANWVDVHTPKLDYNLKGFISFQNQIA